MSNQTQQDLVMCENQGRRATSLHMITSSFSGYLRQQGATARVVTVMNIQYIQWLLNQSWNEHINLYRCLRRHWLSLLYGKYSLLCFTRISCRRQRFRGKCTSKNKFGSVLKSTCYYSLLKQVTELGM